MGELNALFDQVAQEWSKDQYSYKLQYIPACKGMALIRSDGTVVRGLPLKVIVRSLLDTAHDSPDELKLLQPIKEPARRKRR